FVLLPHHPPPTTTLFPYTTLFRSHNGSAVAECVLTLRAPRAAPSVEIFVDILGRSIASDELVEEFLEMDWGGVAAHLTLNRVERSEEHTSELQSRENLVCRLLLEK